MSRYVLLFSLGKAESHITIEHVFAAVHKLRTSSTGSLSREKINFGKKRPHAGIHSTVKLNPVRCRKRNSFVVVEYE